MSLGIGFVRDLSKLIEPTVAFLSRPLSDLFARQHIIVPTAGVKAWLSAQLATRLGVSRTELGDGVIANVEFSYPGSISRFLQPQAAPERDPWEVERLTFAILEVLAQNRENYAELIRRSGGLLLAARRVADRFDHYHFRRPGMIQQWELGQATLNPFADATGHRSCPELSDEDRWQFSLWKKVREPKTILRLCTQKRSLKKMAPRHRRRSSSRR